MPCLLQRQVVPSEFDEVFVDHTRDRAKRAMSALPGMKKLDIGELRWAALGS